MGLRALLLPDMRLCVRVCVCLQFFSSSGPMLTYHLFDVVCPSDKCGTAPVYTPPGMVEQVFRNCFISEMLHVAFRLKFKWSKVYNK